MIEIREASELYWLAFLLTGHRDISFDIAADAAVSEDEGKPYFAGWMRAWSRRIVISRALAAVRDELAESARRTELARVPQQSPAPPDWSLGPDTTGSEIEKALLAVDIFPRAAVVLSIFERVAISDAVTLLNAGPTLVRKAQAMGLRELTSNLARTDGYVPALLADRGLSLAVN